MRCKRVPPYTTGKLTNGSTKGAGLTCHQGVDCQEGAGNGSAAGACGVGREVEPELVRLNLVSQGGVVLHGIKSRVRRKQIHSVLQEKESRPMLSGRLGQHLLQSMDIEVAIGGVL